MRKISTMALVYFIGLVCIIGVCLVKINIENTKALSPLGVSAEDNFKMVSSEFGEDFKDFIQDKAAVKIYEEEDGILMKFGKINFKIKEQSELVEGIKEKISLKVQEIAEFISGE